MMEEPFLTFPKKQFHAILQGHVLDCLARLPDDSIDTIITSPPYWGLRDYKLPPTIWDTDPKCEHDWSETEGIRRSWGNASRLEGSKQGTVRGAMTNVDALTKHSDFCSKCSAWKGQLGLEPDFRLYVRHLLQIMKELKRVLKPTGCLFLNLGDTYSGSNGNSESSPQTKNVEGITESMPRGRAITSKTGIQAKSLCFIPQRVALAMIDEQDWVLRNFICWFKPNGMPSSVRDRFSNRWEPMFFFTKEPRYWFDLDAVREAYISYDGRKKTTYDKSPKAISIGDHERWPEGGKNPGDVIREPAVRSKSWQSNPGHEFTHDRRYAEGKDGTDFWEITTEPHPFAHFAVYPDALVERPIKASCPAEVCVRCGKARERMVKSESNYTQREAAYQPDNEPSKVDSTGWQSPTRETLGWTSCSCNEPIKIPSLKIHIADPENFLGRPGYRPGIVLDPFAGSGTTAVVAKRLQRSSISIELATHYIPIIKERLDFGHETIDNAIEWLEP